MLFTSDTVNQVSDDPTITDTCCRRQGPGQPYLSLCAPVCQKSLRASSMHWQRRRLRGSLARCNIIRHAMLNPSVLDDWSHLQVLLEPPHLASDFNP